MDNKIEITLENGEKINGEIIFTFESNGDEYIIYELEDQAFAGKILEDGSLIHLEEDEWNIVEKIYQEYLESDEEEYFEDEDA